MRLNGSLKKTEYGIIHHILILVPLKQQRCAVSHSSWNTPISSIAISTNWAWQASLMTRASFHITVYTVPPDNRQVNKQSTLRHSGHVHQTLHPNSLTPPQLANICLLIFPVGSRTHAEGSVPLHGLDGCLMAWQSPIIVHA